MLHIFIIWHMSSNRGYSYGTYNVITQISLNRSFTGAFLGPVAQSIVNLTSLLLVEMLTALVSTISNSQKFLLKKCE